MYGMGRQDTYKYLAYNTVFIFRLERWAFNTISNSYYSYNYKGT